MKWTNNKYTIYIQIAIIYTPRNKDNLQKKQLNKHNKTTAIQQ